MYVQPWIASAELDFNSATGYKFKPVIRNQAHPIAIADYIYHPPWSNLLHIHAQTKN